MSETESFINEVSEEVRRDQLYGYVRRYGWLAILLVLLLVGGAAFNEYRKADARNAAQSTGDALLAALSTDDAGARATALEEVTPEGPAAAISTLLTAAALQESGDLDASAAALQTLATDGEVPQIYRDLAAFKAALLDPSDDLAARRTNLEALAVPGAPFALLAQEQLALMDIAAGNPDLAITKLRAIAEDAGVSRGLLDRTQTLIVALGGEVGPLAGSDEATE